MKAFEPKKTSKKYKSLFWILIAIILIITAAAVVTHYTNLINLN